MDKPLGVHEGDIVDDAWHLFTPDFAYAKAPYDVRTHEGGEVVRCYPNGGMLHEMGGAGRWFHPCECEVRYVGWDRGEDGLITYLPYHAPGMKKSRRTRQVEAAHRRRVRIEARKHPPGTWWVR